MSLLVAVTFALATTAPVGSVTCPVSVARNSWASERGGNARSRLRVKPTKIQTRVHPATIVKSRTRQNRHCDPPQDFQCLLAPAARLTGKPALAFLVPAFQALMFPGHLEKILRMTVLLLLSVRAVRCRCARDRPCASTAPNIGATCRSR